MQFPDPVFYISSEGPVCALHDWETTDRILMDLVQESHPYLTFELPDKSFVQCVGTNHGWTVDIRVENSDGTFSHWLFGKGPLLGKEVMLGTEYFSVAVDQSQVLDIDDARKIVRDYLAHRKINDPYHRHDIGQSYGNTEGTESEPNLAGKGARPDVYECIGSYANHDAKRILDAYVEAGVDYTLDLDKMGITDLNAVEASMGGTFGEGAGLIIGVHIDHLSKAIEIRQRVLGIIL